MEQYGQQMIYTNTHRVQQCDPEFFCTTFGFIQVWPTTRMQQECAALIHYQ